MYSSNYEDYMQQVLGYSIMPRNTYQMQDIYNIEDYRDYSQNELENMYPDIYKMAYPMVQKVCMRVNGVIDEKMISEMTIEVYNAMEETRIEESNTQTTKNTSEQRSGVNDKKKEETRQQNFMLNDLIRILIIRELLRRQPPRPQMPPPPPRPPMGRPPRPPMGPNYPRDLGYPLM